jgi:hypothetical protein
MCVRMCVCVVDTLHAVLDSFQEIHYYMNIFVFISSVHSFPPQRFQKTNLNGISNHTIYCTGTPLLNNVC